MDQATFEQLPLITEQPRCTPAAAAQFRAHLRAAQARETCELCDAGTWDLDTDTGRIVTRTCRQCGRIDTFRTDRCGLLAVLALVRGRVPYGTPWAYGTMYVLVAAGDDPDRPKFKSSL